MVQQICITQGQILVDLPSRHLIEREASHYGKEEVKDILVQQVGWVKALKGKDEKLEMMMDYLATHVH